MSPGLRQADRDQIDDMIVYVCEQVLKLDAESCLESALHGLGELHYRLAERSEPIVRRFMMRQDISRSFAVMPRGRRSAMFCSDKVSGPTAREEIALANGQGLWAGLR